MKKDLIVWSLVVCAGLIFSAMGLFAQTVAATRYNIPFDFLVGNTLMPAGEYTVKPLSLTAGTRILQKTDGSKVIFVTLGSTESNTKTTKTNGCKLIFSQLKEGYQLSKIYERSEVMMLANSNAKSDKNEIGHMKVALRPVAKIVVVSAL
jgi:hypothetical protein